MKKETKMYSQPITIKDPDGQYADELKKLKDSLIPVSDDEIKRMELQLVDMMRGLDAAMP